MILLSSLKEKHRRSYMQAIILLIVFDCELILVMLGEKVPDFIAATIGFYQSSIEGSTVFAIIQAGINVIFLLMLFVGCYWNDQATA